MLLSRPLLSCAAGCYVILQAAKAGNLAYVKALLLQGQDPNVTDSTGQYTPLIAAAFLAHTEVGVTHRATPHPWVILQSSLFA